MVKVLFVCLGNICRSPTAEGVFSNIVSEKKLSKKIMVDSAGTSGWHIGQPPDIRAQAAAKKNEIDISHLKSRKVSLDDFSQFDYLVGMDTHNLEDLSALCPPKKMSNLSTLLSYAPELGRTDIPDPYYFGSFDAVFNMIKVSCGALLKNIQERHDL